LAIFSFVITHGIYGCRKSVKPKVSTIDTNLPLEAKTAPVGEPDTTSGRITDSLKFMTTMWKDRFGKSNYKEIIEALKVEKDPERSGDLVFELRNSYDTNSVQPLIQILLKDKWAPVRAEAAKALGILGLGKHGTYGESQISEFIISNFGKDVLKTLLELRVSKIIPALKNALHDKDIFVILTAASELVSIGDTSYTTISVLLDIFRKKNIKNWKMQFIPRPDIPAEDQPELKKKQEQDAASLPADALEVLKKVQNKFVIDGLTDALKDKDTWVRENARQALEDLEKKEMR
jgi:hypothetical protein